MEHAPTWLTNSFIYLSAAVLAVPLAKALGLGSIIGYLAAGIAIGPWGLGLVTNVQDILHFAEFGVVLMLFLVGLELEPSRLWSLRRPIFGWGSAQVLGCAAVLFAAGWLAGLPWRISLVAALGLALSSTAIALQVMAERNLHAHQQRAGGLFNPAVPGRGGHPDPGAAAPAGRGRGGWRAHSAERGAAGSPEDRRRDRRHRARRSPAAAPPAALDCQEPHA
jgi:glutathione-regulated potassium-efflux system ancillary protein KefC